MKAPPLVKNYSCLTPEERYRLILAAGARGDEVERDRLVNTGGRITLSLQDHAPYALAFEELAKMTFIALLDEAARYREAFAMVDDARDISGADEAEEEESDDAAEETDAPTDEGPAQGDASKRPFWDRAFDLALVGGYLLRTEADGWKLFCERLNVPPFLLWGILPGFDRLQRALAMAEKAAFVPEGILRWLNSARPKGEPELTAVALTAESVAAALAKAFRERVQWWGG